MFRELNNKTYLVGGAVRDELLGLTPKDHDFVVVETTEVEFRKVFPKLPRVGNHFPVFLHNLGELALARSERSTGEGHCDFEFTTNVTIEEDLSRRDFTICAIAKHYVTGEIVDPFNGVNDLKIGIIRTVGNPVDRFGEDFLRMLRAVRFAGRFGFEIEENTLNAIKENAHNIHTLSCERIKDELFKMASLSGEKFARCIELLDETNLLIEILPEIKTLQNFNEAVMWHPEAYRHGQGTPFCHTLQAIKTNKNTSNPLFNMSILMHDIGKGNTHLIIDGFNRFHSHDASGVKLFQNVANRLKFSNYEKDVVTFCIKHHMKLTHVKVMKKSKVARIVTHEFYPFLKNTIICDDSCREEAFRPEELQKTLEIAENIKKVFEAQENKPVVVNGRQVMELLNIKPSPIVGHIIKTVTERVMDNDEYVCIKRVVFDVFNEATTK